MTTIKELARAAGVSPSTVSIVLSGKAEARKIPPVTQQKVLDTAQRLGYRPNVAARRLRARSESTLVFAVYWASDFRAPMMVRFLRGLQRAILDQGQRCEVIIHPYENGHLAEALMALGDCHAAIICNASAEDLQHLEARGFNLPVVLYNRHSPRFCTVNVDDSQMGRLAADIFASRGHSHAAVLTSPAVFAGMDTRVEAFMAAAEQARMTVQTVITDNSMNGGHSGGLEISRLSPRPDCVFSLSDYLAIGALRAFQETGLQLPDDLELISVGNGDRELEEYASVSLSVIHLPMEEMAVACYRLALDLLDGQVTAPCSNQFATPFVRRESCGASDGHWQHNP